MLWDNVGFLIKVEDKRRIRRNRSKTGRLSFDCFNLKSKNDRAYCGMGIKLSERGDIGLVSALRGMTANPCQTCRYYETEKV